MKQFSKKKNPLLLHLHLHLTLSPGEYFFFLNTMLLLLKLLVFSVLQTEPSSSSSSSSTPSGFDLLLVNGDVGEHTARILVEMTSPVGASFIRSSSGPVTSRVAQFSLSSVENVLKKHKPTPQKVSTELLLLPEGIPQILKLSSLQPDTRYHGTFALVIFDSDGGVVEDEVQPDWWNVKFITQGQHHAGVNVMSCNRISEDGDGGFFPIISSTWPGVDFNVHIGDQIYSEAVEVRGAVHQQTLYAQYFAAYRGIYLATWMNRDIALLLRSAANLMLPDDHDIFSNLNEVKVSINDTIRITRVKAGLHAFLLYQYQLRADISWDSHLILRACEVDCPNEMFLKVLNSVEFFFLKSIGSNPIQHLIGLDTRIEMFREGFERQLLGDHPTDVDSSFYGSFFSKDKTTSINVLGERQGQFLKKTLNSIKDSAVAANEQHLKRNENYNDNLHDSDDQGSHSANTNPARVSDSLLILSSVPLLFLSNTAARLAFSWEGERYPTHPHMVRETDHILSTIFDFVKWFRRQSFGLQRVDVVLVGGDHHLYVEGAVCQKESRVCVRQIVTSGLSRGSTVASSVHLFLFNVYNVFFTNAYTASMTYTADLASYHFGRNALRVSVNQTTGTLRTKPILDHPCDPLNRLCLHDETLWPPSAIAKAIFENMPGILLSCVLVFPSFVGLIVMWIKPG